MLCKTFRLDEDGKVLSPEEILYRVSKNILLCLTVVGRGTDLIARPPNELNMCMRGR